MKLLHALVSGIGSDAASGTARIYKRGGGTRATYYLDFEGTVSVANGADVNLDSKGRAVRYVSEYVQVDVYSSQGVLVTSFVDGESAGDVECRSVAFTGVDYLTGQSGLSKPITLAAILDKWLASAGAVDWKVATSSGALSMTQFASFLGLFINVRDTTYNGGAKGDGTTDDTIAINAAIDAADALGGIVFFPPGTYRTTAALTPGTRVWLWGCGPGASVISLDAAVSVTISYSAPSVARWQEIRGLSLTHQQANGSNVIQVATASVALYDCQLGSASNTTGLLVAADNASGCDVLLDGVTMRCTSTRWLLIGATSLTAHSTTFYVKNCLFTLTTAPGIAVVDFAGGCDGSFDGCIFDGSAISAGSFDWINPGGGSNDIYQVSLSNCQFIDPTGTAVATCLQLNSTTHVSARFIEHGNLFGIDKARTIAYGLGLNPYVSSTPRHQLTSREARYDETTDNGAAASPLSAQFGTILWHRTAAGAQTLTMDAALAGAKLALSLWNDGTGGNIIFTWPANVETGAATTTVADNSIETWFFVSIAVGTSQRWKAVGTGVEDTEF